MTALVLAMLLAAGPSSFPALMDEAGKLREADRVDEAIALYRRAVKLSPSSAEAWWYLGMCLYERDRFAEAETAFRRLTALEPKRGAGYAMQGLSAFAAKRYDAALPMLRKAHALGVPSLNDLDKIARYHLVILLSRAGEYELSTGLMMTFVAANAVTPKLKEAAGIAALRLPHLPGDVPAPMQEAVRLAGDASILAWQKRSAEAKRPAEELLARHPELANAHYLMGYLLLLDNDERAIARFEKTLALEPGHVQARQQIAYEYFKRGRAGDAEKFAREAVEQAPGDFVGRNIYGRVLLELGRVADAVRELEAAVKLAPGSPEAHFHLASAYQRAGRKAEAAQHRKIFAELEQKRGQ